MANSIIRYIYKYFLLCINFFLLQLIKNKLKITISSLAVTNIKGIWDSLYQQFKKSYESKKFQPSGSGAGQDELSCEFYDNLLFLADHVEHRVPLSSLQDVDEMLNKKRSIWQPPSSKKTKFSGTENHATKSAYKVPEWSNFAKSKYEEQIQAKELLKDSQILLHESTQKIINVVQDKNTLQCQSIHENSNYFKIFFEKLEKVDEDERDDCFVEILECIEEFKV